MLSSRWKGSGGASAGQREALRTGQIRSFRIALLEPATKTLELELAD
jgi:hypothetical protein